MDATLESRIRTCLDALVATTKPLFLSKSASTRNAQLSLRQSTMDNKAVIKPGIVG